MHYFKWQENKDQVLYLLIKLILLLVKDHLNKIKLVEELKLNFLYKCKVLVINVKMYLYLVLLIYHGLLILLLEEDFKKEYIFLYLILKLD